MAKRKVKRKVVSIKDSIKILNNLWRTSTKKQKETLLKARGLNKSWAKAKTIKEMVERGGGMIARDLLTLVKIFKKRNPKIKRVIFKK